MQGKARSRGAIELANNRQGEGEVRGRGRYLFEHTSLSLFLFRSGTRTGMPLKTKDVTEKGNRAFCLLLFIWHTPTHPIMDNKEQTIIRGRAGPNVALCCCSDFFCRFCFALLYPYMYPILQAGCTLYGDEWLYRFVPSSGAHVRCGI